MKEIKIDDLCKVVNPLEFAEKPGIILAKDETRCNGMTIGWCSFGTLWEKKTATVYIHKMRYSKEIFDKADAYSICILKDEDKTQLGYFGSVSGRDEDKMANCGMDCCYEDIAPYFTNSKVVVLCRMMGRSDFDVHHVDDSVFDWYTEDGVHTLYYGEIIKVLVSEDIELL